MTTAATFPAHVALWILLPLLALAATTVWIKWAHARKVDRRILELARAFERAFDDSVLGQPPSHDQAEDPRTETAPTA